MFTFGLFSTHIPYLAFVLFYAVFFFFGVEQTSAGGYEEGEQIVPKEISIAMDYKQHVDNDEYYGNDAYQKEKISMLFFFYCRQGKIIYPENISLKSSVYLFSYFSRPPPAA